MGLCARDIMTADVICAVEEMTITQLAHLLNERRVTGAPVLDAAGALAGVVSLTDIVLHDEVMGEGRAAESDYHRQAEHVWDDLWESLPPEGVGEGQVKDIMSREVVTAQVEAPIEDLAGLMYTHRIHRVIVLDGGRLAGIVSTLDILRAVMERRVS